MNTKYIHHIHLHSPFSYTLYTTGPQPQKRPVLPFCPSECIYFILHKTFYYFDIWYLLNLH
jgi:hypothetical protein